MSLVTNLSKGEHHPSAAAIFDFSTLDAFHHQEILQVIYGSEWYSVLITEGKNAFLHVFSPQPLPVSAALTQGFDIEPFIGYNGPVLNTHDEVFREEALASYSKVCCELGIIAEVIRFNPLLHNEKAFQNSAKLQIFQAKDIVVVECHASTEAQLAAFGPKLRPNRVRRNILDYTSEVLDKKKYWSDFIAFYYASLDRLQAEQKWYYSPELFERAKNCDFFQVYLIKSESQWASLSLVIEHPLAGYYFVAASSETPVQGANELLVFSIAQQLNQKGINYLIMGGGNTASDEDPLLRFKLKFAHEPLPLMMGKIVHDASEFKMRVTKAVTGKPELEKVNFFLKYRLV